MFRKLALIALSVAPVAEYHAAVAQEGQGAVLEEVYVTARRTQERLSDVPIAVTAVSGYKLQGLDLRSTTDVARYVPSLEFPKTANGYFAGRLGARPIIIRGLNLANSFGTTSAALVFLDGAPLLGGEIGPGIDYERVEVLRGPQSVLFGRSTLSGAINYVAKPIADTLAGQVEVKLGAYDTRALQASISGPLTSTLKLGLSLSRDENGGYYNNGAGGKKLGATRTDSVAARAEWQPFDRFHAKLYANLFRNDDGLPAVAQVPAAGDNCSLGGPTRWYCGSFPDYKQLGLYIDPTLAPSVAANIFGASGLGDWNSHFGVQRKAAIGHLSLSYDLAEDLTLNSITAYEWDVSLGANNGKLKPAQPTDAYAYYIFSAGWRAQNFMQELRLNSSGKSRLKWTAGASYVMGSSIQQFLVDFRLRNATAPAVFNSGLPEERNKATGIYGGVYYDLIPEDLKLSIEGRYQWDDREGVPAAGASLQNTFKSFSPRISLDYRLTPSLKSYVSFARGTRPGGFNLRIPPYINNAPVMAELTSKLGPATLTYDEETLDNYELGVKGAFLGGRARMNADVYYGKLKDQQVANSAFITRINNTLQLINNIGQTTLYGVEIDGSLLLRANLVLSGAFSYGHTKIDKYLCTSCVTYTGTTDVSGSSLFGAPVTAGSLAVDYTSNLGATGWMWFAHVDDYYRGKQYLALFGNTQLDARNVVNLRGGVEQNNLTIEGFVTNVTDNRDYVSYTYGQDYSAGRFTSFGLQLPEPRVFGARVRYSF